MSGKPEWLAESSGRVEARPGWDPLVSPDAGSEQTQHRNSERQGCRETLALGQPQAGRGLGQGEGVLESSPWLEVNNFAAISLRVLRRDWVQDQRDREKEMLHWKCLCLCVYVCVCECECMCVCMWVCV